MYLSRMFNSINVSMQKQYVTELLEMNQKTKEYGLILNQEDIEMIMVSRNKVLHSYGRVELSIEVTKELVEAFSTSSFIQQENYVDTLSELHEVFYYLKNETEDKISDRELLLDMKQMFEEDCEGSLVILKSKLEENAQEFRRELQKSEFLQEGEEDDDWNTII